MMAKKQTSLSILLSLNSKQFEKGLLRASKQLKKFGASMSSAGSSLSAGITGPLAALSGIAGKTAVDFEFAMAKVAAVGGFTAEELSRLEAQAKALGGATSKSASEVSSLQLELAKLGRSSNEIEAMTGAITNLSIAFDLDLGQAAESVGATLNRFGLDATQAARVTDVMAKAFGSSALDLERFEASMGKLGPTASALGISLEDATAAVGILTNNGVEAATAGVALTKALTTLAQKGVAPEETLRQLFSGSLSVAEGFELFGDRAGKIIPVLQNNGAAWEELSGKLRDSQGAAAQARNVLESTTKGGIDKMKSALEALALSFSDILLPRIEKFSNIVSNIANKISQLDAATKRQIATFAGIAGAIGPVLMVGGKLSSLLGSLVGAFAGVSAPVLAAIAAIAAAAIFIYKNWEQVKDYFTKGEGTAFLNALVSVVEGVLNFVINYFALVVKFVSAIWEKFGAFILEKAVIALSRIQDVFSGVLNFVGDLFYSLTNLVKGNWSEFGKGLVNTALSAVQLVITAFEGFATNIAGIIDFVLDKIGVDSDLQGALAELALKGQAALEGLKFETDKTKENWISLGDAINYAGSAFSMLSGLSLGAIPSLNAATSAATQTAQEVQKVGDLLNRLNGIEPQPVLTFFDTLKSAALTTASQIGEALAGAVQTLSSGLADAIVGTQTFAEAMKGVFKSLIQQILTIAIGNFIASALSPLAPENIVTGGSAGLAKAGGGKALVGSLFKSLPAFANGGAVLSEQIALIGEKAGSKGEAIIPFERMTEFARKAMGNDVFGPQKLIVEGRISGSDIAISNARGSRLRSRI
jgi:hypothetical protein